MSDENGGKDGEGGGVKTGFPCDGHEYVIPGPMLPNGEQIAIHHHADHSVSQGTLRELKDGQPLSDGAVLCEKQDGSPFYRVVGTVSDGRRGPAKVSTPEYRRGWDEIFGKRQPVGQA